MVDLCHQGHLPMLESFDHIHLPQWPVEIQWSACYVGRKIRKLSFAPWRRQAGSPKMVVQIEIRILDPQWEVEVERDMPQSSTVWGQKVEAALDHWAHFLEAEISPCGRGIENEDPNNVHLHALGLHRKKCSIQAAHALHRVSPPSFNLAM